MNDASKSDLEMRQLPDSPDARLFVELSSYKADLGEAQTALELALTGLREGGPLANAQVSLIGYAAVAYCRTYFSSKVRKTMTKHVSIPDEHSKLHAHITEYRNRQVAHSQSQLSSTFAFIGFDAQGIRPGVLAFTASQEIPYSFLERWIELIDHLMSQLSELQTEVEARILTAVAAMSPDDVRAWKTLPDRTELPVTEFTARTSRGRYPTQWTTFWSRTD
jgi:hypothetical protein